MTVAEDATTVIQTCRERLSKPRYDAFLSTLSLWHSNQSLSPYALVLILLEEVRDEEACQSALLDFVLKHCPHLLFRCIEVADAGEAEEGGSPAKRARRSGGWDRFGEKDKVEGVSALKDDGDAQHIQADWGDADVGWLLDALPPSPLPSDRGSAI